MNTKVVCALLAALSMMGCISVEQMKTRLATCPASQKRDVEDQILDKAMRTSLMSDRIEYLNLIESVEGNIKIFTESCWGKDVRLGGVSGTQLGYVKGWNEKLARQVLDTASKKITKGTSDWSSAAEFLLKYDNKNFNFRYLEPEFSSDVWVEYWTSILKKAYSKIENWTNDAGAQVWSKISDKCGKFNSDIMWESYRKWDKGYAKAAAEERQRKEEAAKKLAAQALKDKQTPLKEAPEDSTFSLCGYRLHSIWKFSDEIANTIKSRYPSPTPLDIVYGDEIEAIRPLFTIQKCERRFTSVGDGTYKLVEISSLSRDVDAKEHAALLISSVRTKYASTPGFKELKNKTRTRDNASEAANYLLFGATSPFIEATEACFEIGYARLKIEYSLDSYGSFLSIKLYDNDRETKERNARIEEQQIKQREESERLKKQAENAI